MVNFHPRITGAGKKARPQCHKIVILVTALSLGSRVSSGMSNCFSQRENRYAEEISLFDILNCYLL